MDTQILMEMNDIQTELTSHLGLITVIADGLSAFSRDGSLSGPSAQRYINALYITFDALSGMNEKLRQQLDLVRERLS